MNVNLSLAYETEFDTGELRTENPPVDESFDMLIFISPQYANNKMVKQSVNRYIDAVNDDLSWNTKLILINSENNDFKKIDEIIESYYRNYSIKACIMVGEDLDTALGGDTDYKEGPSTVPWHTVGGEIAYESGEHGIIGKDYRTDICVSLIYPMSEYSYYRKCIQIARVFNKFSTNRDILYTGDLLVFVASDTPIEGHILDEYGNLEYVIDPTISDIFKSFIQPYSLYCIRGHSNPSLIDINGAIENYFDRCYNFYSKYVDFINTPLFIGSGCYVDGWWSDYEDNNHLDPSIHKLFFPHFSSRLFSNQKIRVMVLGFPFQGGYPYPVSFIENAIPDLVNGTTLAESMIGDICMTVIIYGDPTFHFTIGN